MQPVLLFTVWLHKGIWVQWFVSLIVMCIKESIAEYRGKRKRLESAIDCVFEPKLLRCLEKIVSWIHATKKKKKKKKKKYLKKKKKEKKKRKKKKKKTKKKKQYVYRSTCYTDHTISTLS